MDVLLRKWVEWKGRRRAAQVIVFDGGAEVERTRAFFRGGLVGAGLMGAVFALAAPSAVNPALLTEIEHSEALTRLAAERTEQAMEIARVCVQTAAGLEQTLANYQHLIGPEARVRARTH
jgi:hypothetical protein